VPNSQRWHPQKRKRPNLGPAACGITRIPRNPKLTARPQYEARAYVIYFVFVFAFFFFFAMTLFLECV
jgi:hypothetical protein